MIITIIIILGFLIGILIWSIKKTEETIRRDKECNDPDRCRIPDTYTPPRKRGRPKKVKGIINADHKEGTYLD